MLIAKSCTRQLKYLTRALYFDDLLNKSRLMIPYCSSGGKGNSEQEAEEELDDVDDDDGVKQRRKHFA